MAGFLDEGINKSKLFYDGLLPGNIVRLQNYSYAKVAGVSNNDEDASRIDAQQLISVASRVIKQWGELTNAVIDPALERALEYHDEIKIVSPDGVYVDPFPMLLTCSVCKKLDYHLNPRDESDKRSEAHRRIRRAGGKPYIPCRYPGCNGHMKQLKLIAIHRCGVMIPLQTPGGARRSSNLKYEATGGGVFQSNFVDMDNGDQFHSLQPDCRSCLSLYPDSAQSSLRATPVTNKDRLYPKNIQYLCLNESTGRMVANAMALAGGIDDPLTPLGKDVGQGIASALLGLASGEDLINYLRDSVGKAGPDDGEIERITKELNKQRNVLSQLDQMGLPEDTLQTMQQLSKDKITELEGELKRAQGVFAGVEEYIHNDELLATLVHNRRAVEAVLLPQDFKERETTKRYADQISCPEERSDTYNSIALLKERFHVKEVSHYPQVNVVLASLGFTRELSSPPEGDGVPPVVLSPYQDVASSRYAGKQLFYALPAETEAIEIKLDPCAVLRWCVEQAGWENPGSDVVDDEVRAKAYLLLNCPALSMSPPDVLGATKDRPLRESAPFHLLHSISHSLLATIKPHTGYDEKSVMEYLLPMDLSILLYVTSVQNYTAGGLLTLFRHHQLAWFNDASNFALTCVFDPICSDRGAACSGCIQEVLGCETFNHGLSRSYIHGGTLDPSAMITIPEGFWQ
ncbi:hypothetical protein NCG89_02965 [Spongiibacter taiwanensis]|uniref:hypothetical protein n=1 Tax=Spongiibacter taiwanensis TaxID=1748242 RepID=UPI0020357D39|nr:hypothetical protein [Spongiibacter taiwanensis]USA43756.1 hypothetical protein NCG89_02965 [Spongiibacter taiwanensis]